MRELTIKATVENIDAVTDFVNEQLEILDCPMKTQMQIDVAIDEVFGNICHYAYGSGEGEATVRVDAACCAGVTPESHAAALTTMKMCQIDVI